MTPETHKYTAAAGSFLFWTDWKWRSTGHTQFDHHAVCTTIIVPQWSDQRLRQHKSWSSQGSWWSNSSYVGSLCGYMWKGSRNKSQNEISCTKRSISPRSTKIPQTVWWSETSGVQIVGWQRGFLISSTLRKFKSRNYVTGRWVLAIKIDKQGNFLRAKARWVFRGFQDKQKEYQQTDSLLPEDPDFGWVAEWETAEDGIFFILTSKRLFFKDSLMMWSVTLCVNCHQKQVILLTLLQDWRNLQTAWMMFPDGGGISFAKHCVVVAWFPHELIDAVTCCTQHSRVSEPWTNGTTHSGMIQAHLKQTAWQTEVDAAHEEMLDPIAGIPATWKSVARIINLFADDLFGTGVWRSTSCSSFLPLVSSAVSDVWDLS